jgi:hypothetical protein
MLKRGGEILEEPDGEKPLRIGNADIVYTDCIPHQINIRLWGTCIVSECRRASKSCSIQAVHCPIVFRKRDRKESSQKAE